MRLCEWIWEGEDSRHVNGDPTGWGSGSVVEHLPIMCEAPSSILSTTENQQLPKKKKKKNVETGKPRWVSELAQTVLAEVGMGMGKLEIIKLENGEESWQSLRLEARNKGTGEGLPCW